MTDTRVPTPQQVMDRVTDSIADAQLAAILRLIAPFNAIGLRKNAFSTIVGNVKAVRVPWTPGHSATIIVPSAPIWVGGNNGVSVGIGANAGLPLAANQPLQFGPEEGDSETWLIGSSASIDVRCFEIIPKAPDMHPPAPGY